MWWCSKYSCYWSTSVSWDYQHQINLMGWWSDAAPARDEILSGSRWKMLQAPSVDIPTGHSLSATFVEKDNHTSPGKCMEKLDKPSQSRYCSMSGFPEKLEELRVSEITSPPHSEVHIPFLMYLSPLLPRKHFCFWILIRCISAVLKKTFYFFTHRLCQCFSLFFLLSGKNSNRKWDSAHPHVESVRLRPLSVRGRK